MPTTTNFGWSLATVGGSAATWGSDTNAAFGEVDADLFAHLPRDGSRPMTGTLTLAAGSTSVAPAKFQAGALLTTPVNHAVEWDGTDAYVTSSAGSRRKLAYRDSDVTGNAATATKWATARTLTFGGDVSGSVVVDGSEDETVTLQLGAGVVGLAELADMPADTLLGDNGSGPAYLTVAQVLAMLGVTVSVGASSVNVKLGGFRIQAGRYAGGSSNPTITFATPFASTPIVVTNAESTTADAPAGAQGLNRSAIDTGDVTASSFKAWLSYDDQGPNFDVAGNAIPFQWIAVGAA